MASYVVTGAGRGLGYGFLQQLSSDPNNTVIGIVRNKAAADTKIKADSDLQSRSNIHILEADVTDYNALKKAAEDTSTITGGKLDYLIQNAGIVPLSDAFDGPGTLGEQPEVITKTLRDVFEVHVIGTVHTVNSFLPLIKKGNAKRVAAITSGYADDVLTREYELDVAPFYSSSKSAQNTIIAKYHAQYKSEGILFLSVAPGTVEVGHYNSITPEQMAKLGKTGEKFVKYAPHFAGPITVEESIKLMTGVIDNATIEKDGGDFVSQFGNKQWL